MMGGRMWWGDSGLTRALLLILVVGTMLAACELRQHVCDRDPARPECQGKLDITEPLKWIARQPGTQIELTLDVYFPDGTSTARVTLHPKLAAGSDRDIVLEKQIQNGKLRLSPDAKALSCGRLEVHVEVGSETATIDTRVYTPPVWSAPLTATWTGTDMPLAATILTTSGESALFVTEQYRPPMAMFDRRRVAKYTVSGGALVRTPGFDSRIDFSRSTLLAVTQHSILGYELDPGLLKYVVRAFSLTDTTTRQDDMVQTQMPSAQLFAVDSWGSGSLRMLATASRIEAFGFDLDTAHEDRGLLPLSGALALLVGRHRDLSDGKRIDALALADGSQLPQVLAIDSGNLAENAALSEGAKNALMNRIGSSSVSGLALEDLDCDELPDLILATGSGPQKVKTIVWAPYLGDGTFGDLRTAGVLSADLPAELPSITGMSIGDLNGDGKADLALVGDQKVYVYLNQSL